MTLLVMLMICIVVLLVALGCICLWMAFFCKKCYMIISCELNASLVQIVHLWVYLS
jgi:hypothetical protein